MSASLPSPEARHFGRRPDEAWRDVPHSVARLAVAAAAFAWLPMLALAIAERLATRRPEATLDFVRDYEAHVRMLLALPLLIIGDALTSAAIHRCEAHVVESGIADSRDPRLVHALEVSRRLRTSRGASLLIAIAVIAVAVGTSGENLAAWLDLTRNRAVSWASAWHGFVAFPIFRFFLLRWLFRWLVWAGFLLFLRRLDLALVATHPDRSGGLGFLTVPVSASFGIVFGVTLAVATSWRQAIVSHVATIAQVRAQALLLAAVWMIVLLGPLMVFAPRLLRLKRVAVVEYSRLGDEYMGAFQQKWLRAPRGDEKLLGTPDIQSLADLGTAVDVVHALRPTPFDHHLIAPLLGVYASALLPVVLSQISLDELLARLIKVVL